MAVTIQVLSNGPRNYIIQLAIAGANADAVIIDASTVTGISNLSFVEAQWSLTGAGAQVEWDATTDVQFLEMTQGNGFEIPAQEIPNNAGAGKSGNVLLTNDIALTTGTAVLKFHKT